jgi:hypothetical protein
MLESLHTLGIPSGSCLGRSSCLHIQIRSVSIRIIGAAWVVSPVRVPSQSYSLPLLLWTIALCGTRFTQTNGKTEGSLVQYCSMDEPCELHACKSRDRFPEYFQVIKIAKDSFRIQDFPRTAKRCCKVLYGAHVEWVTRHCTSRKS